MLKVKEIFRETNFSKTSQAKMNFKTRDVLINPKHIICIRPNQSSLYEGKIDGVLANSSFCTISLNKGNAGLDIVVVGNASELQEEITLLQKKDRGLLHG
jgi:hypothetical protein